MTTTYDVRFDLIFGI